MSVRELLTDSRSERLSVKHTCMMIATCTLAICTAVLTGLVFWRVEVVPVLTAFGMTLGGIAGSSYIFGKPVERQKEA